MKIIYTVTIMLISINGIKAQSCEGFFPMNKGTIIETTSYNDKNKPQSVSTTTIKSVDSKGDAVVLGMHSDIVDEKGKNIASSDYDASCDKGSFSISMKSMISADQLKAWKDMTVTMDADDMNYPADLKPGQALKDAHLKVNVTMNGMSLPGTTIDITNRFVMEGKETITTPAGTFECIMISSNVKFKNIVGYETHTIEWLSKGNGVIKTESSKGEKVKGYTLLTKLTK